MALAAPCRCWAAGLLLLAAAGSLIFLSGIGASHTACWDADLELSDRIALFASGGLVAHPSCAYSHGWSWIVVWTNIGAVTLAGLSLFWARAAGAKLGALALLTLSCSFLMPLCNSWLTLHYNVGDIADSSRTARAINCVIAGTIISTIANLLVCFMLGWRHDDKAVTTTCCQKTQKPTTAEPAPTVAVTADAAFTTKQAQAAALASQV